MLRNGYLAVAGYDIAFIVNMLSEILVGAKSKPDVWMR